MDPDQTAPLGSGFIVFVSMVDISGVHFDIRNRHHEQTTF